MIIDSSIITIGSKLISIAVGLASLFLLFEIKSRVVDGLKQTFIYFIISDICMICIRALGIMDELGIWVSTFYDSAIVIFSIFLLLTISSLYKFVINKTDDKEDYSIKKKEKKLNSKPEEKPVKKIAVENTINKYLDLTGRKPKFKA
jgi:hypothetical protein